MEAFVIFLTGKRLCHFMPWTGGKRWVKREGTTLLREGCFLTIATCWCLLATNKQPGTRREGLCKKRSETHVHYEKRQKAVGKARTQTRPSLLRVHRVLRSSLNRRLFKAGGN
jgi:hypothetical protein